MDDALRALEKRYADGEPLDHSELCALIDGLRAEIVALERELSDD